MTRTQLVDLIPYLGSLFLSLGVLIYTYTQRHAQGARAFFWYVGGQTLWIFGFIVELIVPSLQGKIFWDGVQWMASALSWVAFIVFAVQYTSFKLRHRKRLFALSLLVPFLLLVFLLADPYLHWIYANPILIPSGDFKELQYNFTTIIYLYGAYNYGLLFIALIVLARRLSRQHSLYRWQVAAIILGSLVPLVGTLLPLLNIHLIPQRDPAPLTFAIGNLIIAWGLFRFRIFQVAPVGRDRVFEEMVDPVVILDRATTIVDVNRAMLDLLGMEAEQVIGQSAKLIFADFPIPIKMYTDVTYARTEAIFPVENKLVYYELTVWPLFDQDRVLTGRVYFCHDITAMKALESDLRRLNQVLEERVDMRTRELAEAYETTLEGWARALELRDKETEGHSRRVTETTLKVARALDIPEDEIIHIHRGALLHDIGKMGIPDSILSKPGPLTDEERAIVLKHPETAYELLSPVPFLHKALDIPYCHHERWDGSGYPRGLKERAIPLAARVFAVVDVWDAVQSERPYNRGWPREKALAYLKEQAGSQFDPHVVDIFLKLAEIGEI